MHYVKDMKFFKIAKGMSSLIYADFPIDWIYDLLSELMFLDKSSKSLDAFFETAKNVAEDYNNYLLQSQAERLFGTKIEWLRFSIDYPRDYYREKKCRLRLNIRWNRFLDFIDNYSKDEIELWKKYRYISNSKQVLCLILTESKGGIRDHISTNQENIKNLSIYDLEEIDSAIHTTRNHIESIGENIRNRVINIREKILGRRRDRSILALTLFYIPELISTLDSLKDLANRGVFPSCYREMRKILENLAWVVFDDILYLRSLTIPIEEEYYWAYRPYSDIPKGWYNLKSKFARISDLRNAENMIRR